jgi:hypothetical protein
VLIRQIALTCDNNQIKVSELTRVSAALQKQVTNDFTPLWRVPATVDAFPILEAVPPGYWTVVIVDNIEGGVHLDRNGQPYALVQNDASWSLAASHETLEMLADPSGDRLVAGTSPDPNKPDKVEFLVEVCDPCEDPRFGYHVNGVLVSDFYTPSYFDPAGTTGAKYSFKGAIMRPLQVLPGGYLSWHDPVSDHWFQEQRLESDEPSFVDLGILARNNTSLRSMIDGRTRQSHDLTNTASAASVLEAALTARGHVERASIARARRLREEIDGLRKIQGAGHTR